MAGHSHWKQIKEKKSRADEKRGAEFSKLLRAVTVSARAERNPDFNPSLRAAIERARASGVPKENIDRAIAKASTEGKNLEEIILEAYAPGGAALIIQAVTDNKNRTIQEVKNILKDHDGRLADPKSVTWAFVNEGGAWRAKFPATIGENEKKKAEMLIKALKDQADVQAIYHNLKIDDCVGN